MSDDTQSQARYEYVVVGSGAGGGTVAARLAEKGYRVLLLEAGGDPLKLNGGDPAYPNENRLPEDYRVPVFHPFSTENDAMKWDFFVRHYASDELQRKDPKYRKTSNGETVDGVLYPRAGTLGGCTAHNAMITVYPHNEDWDYIAQLTGDSSWSATNMRGYWLRLENCRHRPLWRLLYKIFRINPTRHGFAGWLSVDDAIPKKAVARRGEKLVHTLWHTLAETVEHLRSSKWRRFLWFVQGKGDPNDWRLVLDDAGGLRYPPLATYEGARNGTRERVLDTARRLPERLTVELDALAHRVLFDDDNRAVGVEYRKGARLYRAHAEPSSQEGERRRAYVSREVILAGGAYNSPQLLMLSGIGPRATLEAHGIDVRVDLPGVGRNLQDRYEVGVVNRMSFDRWGVLDGAKFARGDPQYADWEKGNGVYTTNGAVAAVIKRSVPERRLPDLFCFALLGLFRGYFPEYSKLFAEHLNYLTWAILKGHTNNTAGEVTLRSTDPRDPPYINFHYFEEGNDPTGEDLQSVVEGIKFVRQLTEPLKEEGLIAEEELPGESVQTDEELADFVRYHAWGHHASCTCRIGKREDEAVVSGDFEVHGTHGLRVVDASVFPRIPGFFIVSSVYAVGEKAADVIAEAAATGSSTR